MCTQLEASATRMGIGVAICCIGQCSRADGAAIGPMACSAGDHEGEIGGGACESLELPSPDGSAADWTFRYTCETLRCGSVLPLAFAGG